MSSFVLSLTRAAHAWIGNALHECVLSKQHWHTFQIIDEEEHIINEFMRDADSRTSIHDLWKITAGDVSLFYYNDTLATWYFGLNLVVFEHTPNGRTLAIH